MKVCPTTNRANVAQSFKFNECKVCGVYNFNNNGARYSQAKKCVEFLSKKYPGRKFAIRQFFLFTGVPGTLAGNLAPQVVEVPPNLKPAVANRPSDNPAKKIN